MSDEQNSVIEGSQPSEVVQPTDQGGQIPQSKEPEVNQAEALRIEREQRRLAEQKAEWLEKLMQNQTREPERQQVQEPEYNPDDVLTYADVQRILDRKEQARQQEEQRRQEQSRQANIARQEQEARQKYQDWDATIKQVYATVSDSQWRALMAADNPAEEVYQWGKNSPSLLREQVTKDMNSQIQRNLKQPVTLDKIGGGQVGTNEANSIKNMPYAEFRKKYIDNI